jgi:hypothetical protein
LYEDFESGKFSIEDIQKAITNRKGIFTSVIKDEPDNDPNTPLEIVDISEDGEITILYDNNIRYVDLEDVEKIEQ